MMENNPLLFVDDSPDGRLQSSVQQDPSNDAVYLNKFEGAQIEYDRRIQMGFNLTQVERDRIAQRKRDP